jgi:4a-hydroxytetrahydrobiopterin dehydratase
MPADWNEVDGKLEAVVKKKDFVEAMAFVNRVADVAEALSHHPDIDIRWNTVTLRLWTHTESAITDKDRELASRIDAVV